MSAKKKEIDYDMVECRVDRIIVLSKSDLSMVMVIGLLKELARSYGVREKEVTDLFDERYKQINLEASNVTFDIVEN